MVGRIHKQFPPARRSRGRAALWLLLIIFVVAGIGSAFLLARLKIRAVRDAKPLGHTYTSAEKLGFRGPVKEVITRVGPGLARQMDIVDPIETRRFDTSGRCIYDRTGDGHKGTCYTERKYEYGAGRYMIASTSVSVPQNHSRWLRGELLYPWPVLAFDQPEKGEIVERTCDDQGRVVASRKYVDAGGTRHLQGEVSLRYNQQGDVMAFEDADYGSQARAPRVAASTLAYSYDSHGNWIRRTCVTTIQGRPTLEEPASSKPGTMILQRSFAYYPDAAITGVNPTSRPPYETVASYVTGDGLLDTGADSLRGPVRSITGLGCQSRVPGDYVTHLPARLVFNRSGLIVSREMWSSDDQAPEHLVCSLKNTYGHNGRLRSSLDTGGPAERSFSSADHPALSFSLGSLLMPDYWYPKLLGPYTEKSGESGRFDADGRLVSQIEYDSAGRVVARGECKRSGNTREVTSSDAVGKVMAHYRAEDTRDKYRNLTSTHIHWITEKGQPSSREESFEWKITYWE